MNLGIDFGSTYTTISKYDDIHERLQDIMFDEGSPYIPSIVSAKEGKYFFGKEAKAKTGKKGFSTYKAFKMMLPEYRKERLKARGYSEQLTPQDIAERFLQYCINETLERSGEEKVDHLVVGVPEVWNDKFDTLDGRNILRNICMKQKCVNSVQIVSEPAAASAFFAYNFLKNTGDNYKGHILLIDYGGGTLDITLTDVALENGAMEIRVEERTGAGENEEGKVGKAGIIYMESVMEQAIRSSEEFEGEDFIKDSKFYKAVDVLEEDLKSSRGTIADVFDEYGVDEIEELDEEEFTTIEYKGEDVSVSYGMLVRVYNEVIAPTFHAKLDEMLGFMKEHGIDYREIKIALVGGFGNFYLVNHQVSEIFRFTSNDKCLDGIINDASDREKAVSMGGALLASGVVSIRNTAPYSIGIVGTMDGKKCYDYGITYKQDIEFDKPYFICAREDGNPRTYFISGKLDSFVINKGENESTAIEVYLKDQLAKKLKDIADFADNQYQTAFIGFSLDSSGIVSLHVRPYNLFERKAADKDHRIVLDSFNNMFSLTAVH